MHTIGIIAEFNPFHLGHAYLIQEAKRLTGADTAVVIMSGDFVQRGSPALIDKFTRSQMALAGGADVVLELPCAYATGSAEYFAGMAVRLLDALGCIDALCFGCEDAQTQAFTQIAELLSDEPEIYRTVLKNAITTGCTYPQAREQALMAMSASGVLKISVEELHRLLSSPNNILALEYIRALHQTGSHMQTCPVLRRGEGYHSQSLDKPMASASAIRTALMTGPSYKLNLPALMGDDPAGLLTQTLQTRAATALRHSSDCARSESKLSKALSPDLTQAARLVQDRYSTYLQYRLWEVRNELEMYLDVTPDLANRIRREAFGRLMDSEQLTQAVRSRQLTEARVRRALLHIFLGIRAQDVELFRADSTSWYVRLLGFRISSAEVLHQIKADGRIPLISKMAGANTQLSPQGLSMLALDSHASDLYAFLEGRDDFDGLDIRNSPICIR